MNSISSFQKLSVDQQAALVEARRQLEAEK